MADDASITISATILPDEISKTISGSMTVTPDDANDKWYYKLTACTTTSTDLIAGYFTDYTAVDDDTAPTAVDAADKVKFLFIKRLNGWVDFVWSRTTVIDLGPSPAIPCTFRSDMFPVWTRKPLSVSCVDKTV